MGQDAVHAREGPAQRRPRADAPEGARLKREEKVGRRPRPAKSLHYGVRDRERNHRRRSVVVGFTRVVVVRAPDRPRLLAGGGERDAEQAVTRLWRQRRLDLATDDGFAAVAALEGTPRLRVVPEESHRFVDEYLDDAHGGSQQGQVHRSSSVATASQGVSNELVRKSLICASSSSSFTSSCFVHPALSILRRGRIGASESVQDDCRERRRVLPCHRGGIPPKELVQRGLSEIPRPERPSVAGDPSSSAPLLPRSLFEPLRGRPFELSRREQSQVDERPVERLVQKFGSFTNRRNGDGDKLVRDGLDRSPSLAQPQRVSRLHVEQVVPRADHVVVVRRGGEDLDEPTRPLRRLVNDRTILRVCARQDEVIANAPPPSREWREVDRRQRRAEDTARRRRTQADRRRAQRNLPREGIRAERARRTSGLI